MVRSSAPMGPRAWSLLVEMPISAPRPNSPPSAKRVEQLTRRLAESRSETKRWAEVSEEVTMASVWREPYRRMCAQASSSESTTLTARMRSRYSALQSDSAAGSAPGMSGSERGSQRISTRASASARARRGSMRRAWFWWTRRVSAALQTAGRWAFELSTMSMAACSRLSSAESR